MKLAAGYIVFDGLETLEASIKSIRKSVDIVIVSYQTKSWRGNAASPKLIPTLQELKAKGLIDEIMEFTRFQSSSLVTPDEVIRAKTYECLKRQSVLAKALSMGATHYLSMDADEFYVKEQFDWAKKEIIKDSLQATAVKYINYLTPELHQGYSRFQVPFIYEIGPRSMHHLRQLIFGDIDPTRGLIDDNYSRSRIFERDKITMHHMELVRENVLAKYENANRYFRNRKDLPTLVEDINQAKLTDNLVYRKIHFGDTPTGNNTPKKLTHVIDQFGLMSN